MDPFDMQTQTVRVDLRLGSDGCGLTLANVGVSVGCDECNRGTWSRILAGRLPAYDGIHGPGWLPEA